MTSTLSRDVSSKAQGLIGQLFFSFPSIGFGFKESLVALVNTLECDKVSVTILHPWV